MRCGLSMVGKDVSEEIWYAYTEFRGGPYRKGGEEWLRENRIEMEWI